MTTNYNVGAVVLIYTSPPFQAIPSPYFTSSGATLPLANVDPATVTLKINKPDGTTLVYTYTSPTGDPTGTINRASTGLYYARITVDQSDFWSYAWSSSGADETYSSNSFYVVANTV